jgi:hypothetical protein
VQVTALRPLPSVSAAALFNSSAYLRPNLSAHTSIVVAKDSKHWGFVLSLGLVVCNVVAEGSAPNVLHIS